MSDLVVHVTYAPDSLRPSLQLGMFTSFFESLEKEIIHECYVTNAQLKP